VLFTPIGTHPDAIAAIAINAIEQAMVRTIATAAGTPAMIRATRRCQKQMLPPP
jgi:hypothetical protein